MSYVKQTWEDLPSENTPITAERLNHIENGIASLDEHKYMLKISSNISAGAEVTIPCYYKVGQAVLDVFLNGERLLVSSDAAGTNGHYCEVGTANSISNKIKTTTDWQLLNGDVLEFIVRGEYGV